MIIWPRTPEYHLTSHHHIPNIILLPLSSQPTTEQSQQFYTQPEIITVNIAAYTTVNITPMIQYKKPETLPTSHATDPETMQNIKHFLYTGQLPREIITP